MQLNDYEVKHNETLRSLGAECTVLLKSNGDFPLASPGKIALYGSGARRTIKGGTGSGEVNSRFFVTIEDGLREAGFTVTTDEWMEGFEAVVKDAKKQFIKDLKADAKRRKVNIMIAGMGAVMPEPEYQLPLTGDGDVAVYVLSRISGEGNDRRDVKGDVYLTETEIRDILAANEKYEKFMLVINAGGPVDLTPVLAVENILVLSQLGVMTGHIFADILLGKANPSGKLTTTWSAYGDYCKAGEFGDLNDTKYKEGIYVGYRYFDTVGKKALFPFGFGLSYTSFQVKPAGVTLEGEKVTVTACVANTGDRAGKEAVQLYVSVPDGRLDQPYQTLAAFAKTEEIPAGGEACAALSFSMREIASYDAENEKWILEPGSYILRLGNSSADTQPAGIIRVGEEICTIKAKNVLGNPGFEDWKPEKVAVEVPEDVPVLVLDPAAVEQKTVVYDTKDEIEPITEKLTDEELALVGIGGFDPKGGPLSIIGNAAQTVAGAAGETTRLGKHHIPTLVMADGPAGLRLTKQYYKDEKGVHGIGMGVPETMLDLLPKPVTSVMKFMGSRQKKGVKIREQYATAIPIGTAIAQSFNTALAEACGDIVGFEMDLFGVHLWLAPALNIHRSILCGRNFEYFSEDPLISGAFAAAITNGVQKHKKRGTTIKHYAANNQEFNRYNNNSCVSERAMREIYLRGFGIAVRDSQPQALMTSYNLLNGTHTSEHRGLITDILRAEFGYKGIVMTDWVITMMTDKASIHPNPTPHLVAAAGGDLFMPGGPKDYEELLGAIRSGEVSREQMRMNATRVFRLIKKDHKRS